MRKIEQKIQREEEKVNKEKNEERKMYVCICPACKNTSVLLLILSSVNF